MAFFSYERILRGVLSWRQAAVFSALLCVLCLAILFHMNRLDSLTLSASVSVFVLVPLALAALIDSVCHILPDPLLLFAAVIALVSLLFSPWEDIVHAFLNAGVFLAIGLAMSRISSFGRGDAKLMGVLGLWLANPIMVCVALLLAFVGAGLFALLLLVLRRAKLRSSIALGPWLIAGSFLSYVLNFMSASISG
ncbi:MAG: prepilin peptidase [Actinomycetaceae bacterium]|nr:prepilin peptidase [Actinomycetaceae bacterium]